MAAAFSASERTVPRRMTLPPSTSTLMRRASSLALRRKASSILAFSSVGATARFDRDQVAHARHSRQGANGTLGVILLIAPLHFAFELDPALADRNLDLVLGHVHVGLEGLGDCRGDLHRCAG